jgi:hypothetical protein
MTSIKESGMDLTPPLLFSMLNRERFELMIFERDQSHYRPDFLSIVVYSAEFNKFLQEITLFIECQVHSNNKKKAWKMLL